MPNAELEGMLAARGFPGKPRVPMTATARTPGPGGARRPTGARGGRAAFRGMAPQLEALFGAGLPSLLQHLARFQPRPEITVGGPTGGNYGRGPGSAGQGGTTGRSHGPDQFSTGGGTPPAPVPENAFQAQLAKLLGWDWAQVLNQAQHG